MPPIELVATIITSIFASTGFWAVVQRFMDAKSSKRRMLLGLGYDRLIHLCHKYIDRGWLYLDELEDLQKYLYEPYRAMGGNGTAELLFNEVKKLEKKNRTE